MTKKHKKLLVRIILAGILLVLVNIIPSAGFVRACLYLVPYFLIGHDILRKALWGIFHGQVLDENFLMAVATAGAYVLAYLHTGNYNEAVFVMLFYQVGEFFQSYAVNRSRRNIGKLMDIRPDHANIEVDGRLVAVEPAEVSVGDFITVLPGERVPIDGLVTEGESALNTSALTGESMPRYVSAGDTVFSGCVNLSGVLKLQTTKGFEDSTVSKILDMVENASSRKAAPEAFISGFARVYTPIVCLLALALGVVPPLFRMIFLGFEPDFAEWIYRALTFLVISCPCALVISVPLSFFAGIGGASASGILVKGANFFEALAKADTVVFDKTGTLTKGRFEVTAVFPQGLSESSLVELAALAEGSSLHPIAKSLLSAYGKEIDLNRIGSVREVGGSGVVASVDGSSVFVGNGKHMLSCGISVKEPEALGTVVHVAKDGVYCGYIVISDAEKSSSKDAVKELKRIGISKTVMLTGDRESAARKVADGLGIDIVHSGLLPDEKVEIVENLLAEKHSGTLVFVGDGINDAPALSRADIGIAMGAIGSDAAIEAADVVLMDDDPMKISKAVKIARKCMGIVYVNIAFAIGIKVICLILGALGYADMWLAVFADVGVMVLAVLNAIRCLFVKNI